MVLYGLTGGVGMGKSAIARYLVELGWKVVDTDQLARDLVRPGERALAEIRSAFGTEVLRPDGSLDRVRLAERVFKDTPARVQLEGILHPKIREKWLAQTEQWDREGEREAVVVIPLLYETGAEKAVNRVICVGCSRATQHKRLTERGWADEEIQGRIRAQWPVEKKMDLADFVIWTESSIEKSREQLRRVLNFKTNDSRSVSTE
ncbi:MAG: dephospho-CoA kinase [Verrucomicrobiota bacterium]